MVDHWQLRRLRAGSRLRALAAGDNVVATARRPETLESLVSEAPERALAVALDVTDQDQIDAGLASVGAVEELEDDAFRQLMDVMFFSSVALVRAVLPRMRQRQRGSIVQMSSMGGQLSMPGFGAYCAAKFALEGLSDALASEVAPYGISVLIVEPGAFATSFGAGRSQVSPDSGHYDDTVGPQRVAVAGMDGSQPGDPAKAAAAILEALGVLDARRPELDEWAQLSRSTSR